MTTKDNKSVVPYKRLFMFKSRWFNTRTLGRYHLVLQLGPDSFSASCITTDTHRCLLVAAYAVVGDTPVQWLAASRQLYSQNPLLHAKGWGKVTLSVANQQYTLVPEQLFIQEQAATYLKFACPLEDTVVVQHTVHAPLNAVVVFGVDAALRNWFHDTYTPGTVRVVHQTSSLIQGAWTYLHMHRLKPRPRLFVHVEAEYLHITAMDKGKLLYYNRFAHKSEDEIVRYLVMVMRTLQLDPHLHEVIVSGNITKSCSRYKKVRKYIRYITLAKKPPYIRFGWTFSRSTAVRYFDILSAHLCH